LRELKEEGNEALEAAREEFKGVEERYNERLLESKHALDDVNSRIEELLAERDGIIEEKRLAEAQLKAYRVSNGLVSEDENFTDKENFDELEREFELFKKFYEKQWKKTKKQIIKNSFKWENLKGPGKKE